MASILEDVQTSANWVAKALTMSGYKADFTPDSLIEVDRFFSQHSRNGNAVQGGLLAESLGQRLFAIGSYIGEVFRRNVGGEWHADELDPQAEINVALHLADGTICWPIQRAMKRFKLGPDEGIAAYGAHFGLQFTRSVWSSAEGDSGSQSLPPKKPWWKVW